MRKQTLLLCVASAALGAAWALWWTAPDRPQRVAAEEPSTAPAAQLGRTSNERTAALPAAPAPGGDEQLTPDEQVNVAVYDNVNRSVVNINTKGVSVDRFFMFEVPSEGAGSGSVLDKQGHILTNFHVVENARNIQVTLYDGRGYEAELVGSDPSSDIAVLRIQAPAETLYPVTLGDSTRLKVGQRVFALGNPFGLERTLTTGIISSLNRSLQSRTSRTLKSIIQTDAAINPGNSGGPLLDGHSRLIGMNTAIASRTGQSSGVGFAIPVATIARIVPQLLEKGKVIRPEMGIGQVYQTDQGLLIATLIPGGPAEQAGLQGFRYLVQQRQQGNTVFTTRSEDRNAADTIVAVNGQKIHTVDQFLTAVDAKQPGDEVTVTVLRGGKNVDVKVKLVAGE